MNALIIASREILRKSIVDEGDLNTLGMLRAELHKLKTGRTFDDRLTLQVACTHLSNSVLAIQLNNMVLSDARKDILRAAFKTADKFLR